MDSISYFAIVVTHALFYLKHNFLHCCKHRHISSSEIDLRSKRRHSLINCEQQEVEIESLDTCVYEACHFSTRWLSARENQCCQQVIAQRQRCNFFEKFTYNLWAHCMRRLKLKTWIATCVLWSMPYYTRSSARDNHYNDVPLYSKLKINQFQYCNGLTMHLYSHVKFCTITK